MEGFPSHKVAGQDSSSVAVHAGRPSAENASLNAPLVLASNFSGVEGRYTRTHGTETWAALETAVAALESAEFSVAFSSGMATASALLHALRPKHLVLPHVCYLGVRSLVADEESAGNVRVTRVDCADTQNVLHVLQTIDRNSGGVLWLETPSNPMLQTADLNAIIPIAVQRGIRVVVDCTFATPVGPLKPLNLGATAVFHSATKLIGGHSDLLLGIAVTRDAKVYERLVHARTDQGATPGSLEAYLCLRGLRTLPLRYAQSSSNAQTLLQRMKDHPAVERALYPGFGNMISFIVAGGKDPADACVATAKLIVRATSLGGVESSFERRAKYAGDQAANVPAGLIRMSVGIEAVDDIWADLKACLDAAAQWNNIVRIPKDKHSTTLNPKEPAATVRAGALVEFETNDFNYEQLSKGVPLKRPGATEGIALETINVVTGPLRVEGAEVGDSLVVSILDIQITRCWSVWECDAKCGGCLAAKRALFSDKSSVRELKMDGQNVHISDRLALPMEPMIGCIATASSDATKASTFEPTYQNGGNMDLSEAKKGNRIILPVLVDGAQLFIGDLHAHMARGEATWVGFEAAGKALVKVEVIKNSSVPFPRLHLSCGSIAFSAVHESSHDSAMQLALGQAYDHLIAQNLTPEEAFGFLTAKAEARFGGPASRQVLIVLPDVMQFLKK